MLQWFLYFSKPLPDSLSIPMFAFIKMCHTNEEKYSLGKVLLYIEQIYLDTFHIECLH